MTKEELKKHYEFLKKSYNDFLQPERNYTRGKNAKIRKAGYDDLTMILNRVDAYVIHHYDLYDLITGIGGSSFDKSIFWDEFISAQYFKQDMTDLLSRIETMLKEG